MEKRDFGRCFLHVALVSMGVSASLGVNPGESLEKIVKRELKQCNAVSSKNNKNCDYDRFVFTGCRKVKPKEIWIWTNPRSPDWQTGFFDADEEVYFDKIELGSPACFSSIIRNYWWNGKERKGKKKGYYSLIKSVKKIDMCKEHINDFIDYIEGRYEIGEHWRFYKLDKNIELKIYDGLKEIIV